MDAYTTAFENEAKGNLRHYDKLILKSFEETEIPSNPYDYLMLCCNHVSMLTDGQALQLFQKIQGNL